MTHGPAGLGPAEIDLVIFDKDGTIIDFHAMWASWAVDLAGSLRTSTGHPVEGPLFAMLGYDPTTDTIRPGGALAATPMARLREKTLSLLIEEGVGDAAAADAIQAVWAAPDPIGQARPLCDLRALFDRFHAAGQTVAIATSDDRAPTLRTLASLGLTEEVDAIVCADDGVTVKPAPDMIFRLCAAVGATPARTVVIGDAPADLMMGRAAGVARVIGVLSGVGTRTDLAPLADVVVESVTDLL